MNNLIHQIVAYTEAFRHRELDDATLARAKQLVLDTLGVSVSGWKEPSIANIFAAVNAGKDKVKEATVFGIGDKASLEHAIICNGSLTRVQDYMDIYYDLDASHPSEFIPFILSCCEAWGLSGRQALRGIVLAYDLQGWFTENMRSNRNGWHYATIANVVASAVLGLLLDMTAESMANTIAISSSTNLTTLGTGPQTDMKTLTFSLTVKNVPFAARLAMNGCTGPQDAVENLLAATGNSDRNKAELIPQNPRIFNTSIKAYPAEFMAHSALEALENILSREPVEPEEIAHIQILVHEWATWIARKSSYDPQNREEADHSLPYCIAARLVAGKLDQSQFQNRSWENESIRKLMRNIVVQADAELEALYPAARPAILEITLKDGRVHSERVDHPLGDRSNPMSYRQIQEKFIMCVSEWMDKEQAERILRCVDTLEQRPVSELMELMTWTEKQSLAQ
ncbi:MmgE/PrpD family protein [Paenibacillus elgii]